MATVSYSAATNKVTAAPISVGSTTITLSCAAGTNYTASSATCTLTVEKATGSISASTTSVSVEKGQTSSVNCSITGDGAKTATSSDESVATATLNGSTLSVAGVAKGQCTITVALAEGTNYTAATCTINVNVTYTPTLSDGGITLKGQALEDALYEGETAKLTATSLGEDSESFKRAYAEFMTSGNYKELKAYDIKLTAVNTSTGDTRTITELDSNVSMTISLDSAAYNDNSVDIQEYHTQPSGSEVTIPYTGLKVADGAITFDVKNFSQFNVLFAKDSVDPGTDDNTNAATSSSSAETGDSTPYAVLICVVAIIGLVTVRSKKRAL